MKDSFAGMRGIGWNYFSYIVGYRNWWRKIMMNKCEWHFGFHIPNKQMWYWYSWQETFPFIARHRNWLRKIMTNKCEWHFVFQSVSVSTANILILVFPTKKKQTFPIIASWVMKGRWFQCYMHVQQSLILPGILEMVQSLMCQYVSCLRGIIPEGLSQ